MRPTIYVLFLFISGCSGCGDDCYQFEVTIHGSRTEQLDNRGIAPIALPPGAEGFLQAYGFEVFLKPFYSDPGDSTLVTSINDECTSYQMLPLVTDCKILTVIEIPGIYPAGADVSDLFRYVDRSEKPLEYKTMPETAMLLSGTPIPGNITTLDFLLIHPPATEGWYQFQLVLTGIDSTVSVSTQPIYLK